MIKQGHFNCYGEYKWSNELIIDGYSDNIKIRLSEKNKLMRFTSESMHQSQTNLKTEGRLT